MHVAGPTNTWRHIIEIDDVATFGLPTFVHVVGFTDTSVPHHPHLPKNYNRPFTVNRNKSWVFLCYNLKVGYYNVNIAKCCVP